MRISSIGVTSVSDDLRITGFGQETIDRDIRLSSEVQVNTAIFARITGNLLSTSSGYDLKVFGQGMASNSTELRIEGDPGTLTSVDTAIRINGRATQIARPDGDISTGDWVAIPSGTLASTVDEVVPNDSDYMKSPTLVNAFPSSSAFNTAQDAISGVLEHFPLTESASPFASRLTANTLNVAIGSPTVTSVQPVFIGESYLQFDSGDGIRGSTATTDYNKLAVSG